MLLKSGEKKHYENDMPSCVTDVISGLFYLSSLPLQLDNTYSFPLNDGGATVLVHAKVEAREQIKTDAGIFNTVRVKPESPVGLLKSKSKGVWIWYSDDSQHIPVQMRGKMTWGTLTFSLQRIEHAQQMNVVSNQASQQTNRQ